MSELRTDETTQQIKNGNMQANESQNQQRKKKLAEDLVGEIENAKYDKRMFKAAKFLHNKHQKVQFVHDEQGRCV